MPYPSDLTDAEFARLEPLLPPHPAKGRPWVWSLRDYVNAIFYVLRSGCAWRMLPHEYPPWQSVYSRFRLWKRKGVWKKVLEALVAHARECDGRDPETSALIIDSQSAKTTEKGGYAGTTRGRRSLVASVTSLSMLKATSSRWKSQGPTSRTGTPRSPC